MNAAASVAVFEDAAVGALLSLLIGAIMAISLVSQPIGLRGARYD